MAEAPGHSSGHFLLLKLCTLGLDSPHVSEFTYAELFKVWRRRREVRLLRLEGFSDLGHSSQDPISRVQEALLQA